MSSRQRPIALETPDSVGWVRDQDAFGARFLETTGEVSGVLLNHPELGQTEGALSLGHALDLALRGTTHSFTALVGYFHHNPVGGDDDDGSRFEDPAQLILSEAEEERATFLNSAESVSSDPSFRLLAGQLNSIPAQIAARAWYLLCRWRHAGGDSKTASSAFRARFIQTCVIGGFRPAAESLLDSDADLGGPFQPDPESNDGVLYLHRLVESVPLLANHQENRTHLRELRDALVKDLEANREAVSAAGILLGFLLQRAADFRMDDGVSQNGGIFHPKMYVIERSEGPSVTEARTVAFVGSNNWSRSAFGMTGEAGRANVEVATVHSAPGHLYSQPLGPSNAAAGPRTDHLTADVAATARSIFAAAPWVIGVWNAGPDDGPKVPDAKQLLALTTANLTGPADGPSGKPRSEAFLRLVPHLRGIIKRLLGVSDNACHEEYVRDLSRPGLSLFAGHVPASYQVDGVLRLLSILEGESGGQKGGSRGAFLTDEPGLGKTLIGQITAAILLTQRLVHLDPANTERVLRASFVVPARLVGAKADRGRNATGWNQRAVEVRDAVEHLLQAVHGLDAAAVAARMQRCELRVLSHGVFSPEKLPDAPTREDVWVDPWDAEIPGFLDAFEFLATSEVVVLDESHNFRNQGARSTRTLRFLLSLPLPGERWPLKAVAPTDGENADDNITLEPTDADAFDVPRRKMLNLSATPFNNRLDDLVTQIGHFLQYQDWARPYATLHDRLRTQSLQLNGEAGSAPVDRIYDSLTAWCSPDTPKDARTVALRRLLQLVRRHLYSGRALTVPPDKAVQRAAADQDARTRYDDLGPEYQWAAQGGACQAAFAAALEWRSTHDPNATDEAAPPDPADTARAEEARRLLEAELTRLFVQRSRIRALRIIDATADGPADAARAPGEALPAEEMFRQPRTPRHPLALNPGENAAQPGDDLGDGVLRFERKVLRELFESLFALGGDNSLSFFAYELSVRSSRSDEQTARNAMGFQKIGLIKRLQSSPYAFLRTLVRGILRQSLAQLAVVERALTAHRRPLEAAALASGTSVVALEDALADLARTTRRVVDSVSSLGEAQVPTPEDLDEGRAFQVRCGWVGPGDTPMVGQHVREYDSGYTKFVDDLVAPAAWVRDLLSDVARGEASKLFVDVQRVAGWIEDSLLEPLYGKLRRVSLKGRPYTEVTAKALEFLEVPVTGTAPRALAEWVIERLRSDGRARSLLGWLVLQAAARRDVAADGRAVLPGGFRSLIFTEYTDTQDYLIAIFTAVAASLPCPANPNPDVQLAAQLRTLLRGAVDQVGRALVEQAHRVTTQPRAESSYTDPARYRSPLDLAWLKAWLARATDDPQLVDHAVQRAAKGFASVWGDGERRLLPMKLDGGTADAVVDAFSPWYQIAPDRNADGPAAHDYLARLSAAARAEVTTLLATDVLAEGVNLQECGVVIHYDLPWNPTLLIQRNGRVDRRLTPAFEVDERRSGLAEALREAAGQAPEGPLPDFRAPQQIDHLTVVPVEPGLGPDGSSVQNQVRARLGSKLEEIRALFGLTNWPVVLDLDSACEVLSGELDFETPGFRRREELFAALRKLDDAAPASATNGPPSRPPGALVVRAGRSLRARLARNLARSAPTARPDWGWETVRAAGVVLWTGPRRDSRPVRSTADAVAATQHGQGAISGTLVRVTDSTSPGALAWFIDMVGGRRSFVPVWLGLPAERGGIGAHSIPAHSATLPGLGAPAEDGPAAGAPTEFADEVVIALVDAGIHGAALSYREDDAPVPEAVFAPPALGPPTTDSRAWAAQTGTLGVVHDPGQGVGAFGNYDPGSKLAHLSLGTAQNPVAGDADARPPSVPNLWLLF